MDVRYSAAARKMLGRMPAGDRGALMNKLDRYAKSGEGDVTKLVGQPYLRLRHGDWRAIFTIEDGVRIAHRREDYR